jgi:hypothetical protein
VNFVLITLLVLQGSFLQHAVAELSNGRSPQPLEGRHGSVARDPIRDGPPRHRDAVLRGEVARRLFLGMAKVVQAQCANEDPRRLFDTLQARQRQEVFATVPAPVNLQLPETVLAQAALDDAAAVARGTALRSRLNRWTEGRRSFHPAGLSSSLLACRDREAMSFAGGARDDFRHSSKRCYATNFAIRLVGEAASFAGGQGDKFRQICPWLGPIINEIDWAVPLVGSAG